VTEWRKEKPVTWDVKGERFCCGRKRREYDSADGEDSFKTSAGKDASFRRKKGHTKSAERRGEGKTRQRLRAGTLRERRARTRSEDSIWP